MKTTHDYRRQKLKAKKYFKWKKQIGDICNMRIFISTKLKIWLNECYLKLKPPVQYMKKSKTCAKSYQQFRLSKLNIITELIIWQGYV